MNTIRNIAIALTMSMTGAAYAAGPANKPADYGQPVAGAAAGRTVQVDAGTKYVNVQDGETVNFVVQGRSFAWHFETYPNRTSVKLQDIAPAGVDAGQAEVYIESNPLYRG
ncbi:CzcE family metal-binding protein [Oxalobacteraceae bacterium A2-2]